MPTINFSWSTAGAGGDWLPYVVVIYALFWFLTLALVVSRRDLDPVTRLLWVVVLIFVPVGGLLLYALFAPARASASNAPRTDVTGTPWEQSSGHRSGNL